MHRKLLVVTGGTKGIGRAVATRFAAGDFDVATCARSAADLTALADDLRRRNTDLQVHTHPADLSDKAGVLGFADFVGALNRPVDVLVNNAGFFVPGQLHQEDDEVLEKMLRTNLLSAYYLTKRLTPDMIARRAGHVFNVGSIAGVTAYPNGGAYGVTKFAVRGFSLVLREELKPHGVRVTHVLPGATLTDSWSGTDLPPERFMPPEDVAAALWSAWEMSDRTVVEEIVLRPQLGDL
ncbi:MAG: SDR family NAD(P)-dependent oxidoreductase [Catalinimonas sp.]